MINALAWFGLCMLLTIIFSVIYIIFIFISCDEEEVENCGSVVILAVFMFFIFSIITANIEIDRQHLVKQIELMEEEMEE